MSTLKLKLTAMAQGGSALGRDKKNRVVFVPQGIPGETVEVYLTKDDKKFAEGTILEVAKPAASRVKPRCSHFKEQTCSHFQHIQYEAQLKFKREVVVDQLKRIGRIEAKVKPVIPSPQVWESQMEVVLSGTEDGRFGYWSATQRKVMTFNECHLLDPRLQQLIQDFDFQLPDLRKMMLRIGHDGEPLVALEVTNVEPPSLEVDFPVSVTIVLPNQTTVNLIGENFVTQRIKEREFQVSAGCYFHINPAASEQLIDTVLKYAKLNKEMLALELFSGSGVLTAFLSEAAGEILAVEINADAIEDSAVNLDHTENVSLYEAFVLDALTTLPFEPHVIVADPPEEGLTPQIIERIGEKRPLRMVYVSHDIATLARDVKAFKAIGYKLVEVQPVDSRPHTYHVDCVALFEEA